MWHREVKDIVYRMNIVQKHTQRKAVKQLFSWHLEIYCSVSINIRLTVTQTGIRNPFLSIPSVFRNAILICIYNIQASNIKINFYNLCLLRISTIFSLQREMWERNYFVIITLMLRPNFREKSPNWHLKLVFHYIHFL